MRHAPAFGIIPAREPRSRAPHSSGATQAKPRDYEPGHVVEAPSAYALWQELRLTEEALQLGDILELPEGQLRIFKYVGFEEAQWVMPEVSVAGNEGTGTTNLLEAVR